MLAFRAFQLVAEPPNWNLGHTLDVFDSAGRLIPEKSRDIVDGGQTPHLGIVTSWAYYIDVQQ
jgi:hypothetical protein